MKTRSELVAWCAGAEERFGDPSLAVGQAFFRYVRPPAAREFVYHGDDLVFTIRGTELGLCLGGEAVPVPISPHGAEFSIDGSLQGFGVEQIAPGLWSLTPSLHLPGVIHVFVTLYEVPEPAPWERLIVLAG